MLDFFEEYPTPKSEFLASYFFINRAYDLDYRASLLSKTGDLYVINSDQPHWQKCRSLNTDTLSSIFRMVARIHVEEGELKTEYGANDMGTYTHAIYASDLKIVGQIIEIPIRISGDEIYQHPQIHDSFLQLLDQVLSSP
jgi:hypothetical protein